jgi:ankyrin repeat protein
MPMPDKINPETYSSDDQLFILNEFLTTTLLPMLKHPVLKATASDAIKVVECFRFIKVNEEFLRYGFLNQEDMGIYTYEEDKTKGVLRDFHDTSFHLNGYKNVNDFIHELHESIKAFERGIAFCKAKNKLVEFVRKIQYDEYNGCLAERIAKAMLFVSRLESQKLPIFEDVMMEAQGKLSGIDENADYKIVFNFFRTYLHKPILYKKNEIELTEDLIINYMIDILGYDKPQIALSSYEEKQENNPRTPTHALHLMKEFNTAGKTILFAPDESKDFNFVVTQLMDPENTRPVKRLGATANRNKRYNPKTNTWETLQANLHRGEPKESKFTKKEAVSLLPYPPKIQFFHYDKLEAIGLLFDVAKLDLKGEKYIWKSNALSNDRWWIDGNQGKHTMWPSVSLSELREYLKTEIAQGTAAHSEQLFGLCKEALIAVFAHQDKLFTRINALRAQLLIQELLNIDLALLIVTEDGTVSEYPGCQQVDDLKKAQTDPGMLALLNAFGQNIDALIRKKTEKLNGLCAAIHKRETDLVVKLLDHPLADNAHDHNILWFAIENDLEYLVYQMLAQDLEPKILQKVILNILNEKQDNHLPLISRIFAKCTTIDLNQDTLLTGEHYALHLAILNKKPVKIIAFLCQQGASLFNKNKDNKSALDLAIASDNSELIYMLLSTITEATFKEAYGVLLLYPEKNLAFTLLQDFIAKSSQDTKNELLAKTIEHKNQPLALELLKHEADVNYEYNNWPVLYLAIKNGLQALIDKILSMNLGCITLETTILDIIEEKDHTNLKVIESILEKHNINLNSQHFVNTGNYTLHTAVLNNKPLTIIKLLCEKGADIYLKNLAGKSALDLANDSGNTELINLLERTKTPLDLAVDSADFERIYVFLSSNFVETTVNNVCIRLLVQQKTELVIALLQAFSERLSIASKNALLVHAIVHKNQQLALELVTTCDAMVNNYQPQDIPLLYLAIQNSLDLLIEKILDLHLESAGIQDTILYILSEEDNSNLKHIESILEKYPNSYGIITRCFAPTSNNALHVAILNNKPLNIIKLLCAKGANLYHKNTEGRSALDLVIGTENFELITILVSNALHRENAFKETYLILIQQQKNELAKNLLQIFSENISTATKSELLAQTIEHKNQELALDLLKHGANVNYQYKNEVVLYLAIKQGLDSLINILLDMPLEEISLQSTILNLLSEGDHKNLNILEGILTKFSSINLNACHYVSTKNYALHTAILNHKPLSIIRLLCERGANISEKNNEGKSPRDLALESEQLELIEVIHCINLDEDEDLFHDDYMLLLSRGKVELALSLIKCFSEKLTEDEETNLIMQTIDYILELKDHSHLNSLKEIFENYKDINLDHWPFKGLYALHTALINEKPLSIIQLLCDKGADIYRNPPTLYQSPLDLALLSDNFEVVHVLLSTNFTEDSLKKAYLLMVQQQKTVLAKAVLQTFAENMSQATKDDLLVQTIKLQNQELALELIQFGADINHQHEGHFILYWAIQNGLAPLVGTLLSMKLCANSLKSAVLTILGEKDDANLTFLKSILEKEVPIDLNDWRFEATHNYAIHSAVVNNKPLNIIKLLCTKGANIFIVNKEEQSALDLAVKHWKLELLHMFIEHACDRIETDSHTHWLIKHHAMACYNYLQDTKERHGIHQLNASKLFLRRILNINHPTTQYIEQEVLQYMKGEGHYDPGPEFNKKGCGHGKHSRFAYAFDLGLFKGLPPAGTFAALPKAERKILADTIKCPAPVNSSSYRPYIEGPFTTTQDVITSPKIVPKNQSEEEYSKCTCALM